MFGLGRNRRRSTTSQGRTDKSKNSTGKTDIVWVVDSRRPSWAGHVRKSDGSGHKTETDRGDDKDGKTRWSTEVENGGRRAEMMTFGRRGNG